MSTSDKRLLDLPGRLTTSLRRKAGATVVDGFFRGMARAGRLHPTAAPRRHGVSVARNVSYVPDGRPEHLLDVYYPTSNEGRPWPVVLYVHGGGFRILSKDSHWLMGLAFARRGFVVFNINYRLAPRHRFPAAMEDACAALVWVAKNAARYGGDTGRMVLAGESAGANLVTSLTLASCYERPEPYARPVWDLGLLPRAVLPVCGMYQVSDPQRFWRRRPLSTWVRDRLREPTLAYLGPSPDPVATELADPLRVLERGDPPERPLPPFFTAVGTKDPLLDDTRRLEAVLGRMGVTCEARYYEGEVHAFHALIWRANARRCWRHTYSFLRREADLP